MKLTIVGTIIVVFGPSPHGEGGLKLTIVGTIIVVFGPSPHGEGGLKFYYERYYCADFRPSPHGEGGLKLSVSIRLLQAVLSLPARGGWIEILESKNISIEEMSPSPHGEGGLKSVLVPLLWSCSGVPPRTGRVD